ncbi:MAG: S-layer homology domain-containing protein [Nitriliruptorales bacterium]
MAVALVPPAADTARAQEDPCAGATAAPFADRDDIAVMHRAAVDCLWHLGIVRGSRGSDGRVLFVPRADVSRAQFAGMAHGMLGALGRGDRLTEPRRPRFRDVPEGHPFDDAVHTLAYAGVVAGVDADSFAPDRPLPREQTASLVVRAVEWATGQRFTAAAGPHFGDVAGSVHRDAIEAAFEYGLVEGTRRPCGDGGGRYAPTASLAREQAASVVVRAIGVIAEVERGEGGGRRGDAECPSPVWQPHLDAAVEYSRQRSGSVSFAVIGTDGRQVGDRAETRVAAASVLKVMFMVAYLRHPDVRDRELTRSDRDLLEPMIRRSANEPATRIANMLGPTPMHALAERAGMQDFSYTRPWGNSRTSARDQVAFMLDVDGYVPSRHREYALGLLTEVVPEQRWGIGQVETEGWTQHFKGGWGSGTGSVDHQVVLLGYEDGTRVALAVMTTSSPSHDYGKATLQGVFSRLLADLP